jgi:DNA-binding NarL/FixJ family response regulator
MERGMVSALSILTPSPLVAATPPLRIVLADDHALVRAALRALIDQQPDMLVVGEAGDGEAAVEIATALRPDIVVMDLSMPKLGGVAATERIVATVPGVRVLALGLEGNRGVQAAIGAGAAHGITKSAGATDFINALRRVVAPADDAPVSERAPESGVDVRALSRRERQVLYMIGQGQARKDMCRQLEVSLRTVETYRARAMEKLSLKTRADIVKYVYEQGWFGE